MAFLTMLWQAGTLESVEESEEPLTGNSASAGSSASQGTEDTASNSSSKVVVRQRLSSSRMRSAQRLWRLAAASTRSSPLKETRPSVTVTSLAPIFLKSKAALRSVPK